MCICIASIYRPVSFGKEQAKREIAVKRCLVKIRYAEEKYRSANGQYTDDLNKLVESQLIAKDIQYIPFSDGDKFNVTISSTVAKSGRTVPLMECSARYDQYLKGLDSNSIYNLNDEAAKSGRFGGLKIGDILTPNNNAGNWE